MITAINSALQGMQRNQQSFANHTERISHWGSPDAGTDSSRATIDLAREMVGVLQSQRGFEANLPVIRAADEMLGSLLDILA